MSSVSTDLLKPVVSAAVAVALDKYYLNENDMNSSLIFGASVGLGTYAGIVAGKYVPDMQLPVLGNGKGLSQRVVEIAGGAGTSYVVHKYVFKNANYREDMMQVVGVCAVADLVGELATDFLAGRPLSIFS